VFTKTELDSAYDLVFNLEELTIDETEEFACPMGG